MLDFDNKYGKYLATLSAPGLNVAEQLVITAGQRAGGYEPPTKGMVNNTLKLFEALSAFDTNPSELTFAKLKQELAVLQMKAVRVAGAEEWIYITPDADPKSEKSKWNKIALNTQFNLSWHVGSDSKVGCSDEHNGSDGAYRVVGELVQQGSNLKLVMSNSLYAKSGGLPRDKGANWGHSKNTIDYPVMGALAKQGFSIINVHGWASRDYGMFMSNFKREYTHDRASLPTMIAIALTKYFPDDKGKKFLFSGALPGSIKNNGVKKPLSPQSKSDSDINAAVFARSPGFFNTNVIGNQMHVINGYRNKKGDLEDSGKSCHIEFGIVRDGRADLKRIVAAINEAAYWMNNYKPELNPWQIAKANQSFDMRDYGALFPENPELDAQFKIVAHELDDVASAKLVGPEDDIDEDEMESAPEDESEEQEVLDNVKPLILSGGNKHKDKEDEDERHKAKKEDDLPAINKSKITHKA